MATLNTGRRPRSPDFDWVVEKIFVGNEAERLELLDRLKHFMAHMGDHGGIPRLYDYDKRLPQTLPKGSSRTFTITWFETPGISLEEEYCQKNKHITIDELLECERQITAALIPMHRAELPHLDIQPDNIMLVNRTELARTGTTGPVYVLRRWGLGKFSLASYDDKSWPFLPPEIDNADLEGPGTASDLYLLAVTLLILYTGRGIFARTETGFEEIRRQHQQEEPDLTGLPSQFRPLFREALAKNPAERPSIEEFRDRFEQAYRAMTARPSRVDTLTETAALIKAVAGKSMTRRAAIALLVMIPLFVLAVAAWNLLQSFAASKRHVLASGGVGTERYTFRQHEAPVKVALPSPDGTKLLSSDESGRVIVSKIDSQELILDDSLRYEGVPVISAAWAPDGRTFATLGQNGQVRLWQLQGDEYTLIEGHSYHPTFTLPVSKIAWSSLGDFMVASGCTVLVFRDVLRNGFIKPHIYHGHADTVTCVTFSPNGKMALSGSNDMTAQLWNVETGQQIATTGKDFDQPISTVAFSPDEQYIGIGSENKYVQVRTAPEFYLLFPYSHDRTVNDLGFSNESLYIASGGDDRLIDIFDLDGKWRFTYRGHNASVTTVKWISAKAQLGPGEWIVSSSGHEIKVWRGH